MDGEMGRFMKWVTLTYTQRWHKRHQTVGYGHLFQGRYKSVSIKDQNQLETVVRYVERNPLTAKLVSDVFDWRYSSLYQISRGEEAKYKILLSKEHFDRSKEYIENLIEPLTSKEIEVMKDLE